MAYALDLESRPSRARETVGLVLGAGGVRGCSHAGVIAVLREARIPVDLVVGASIGSMFGLAVAAGWPTERIVQATLEATPLTLFRFYASRLRTSAANPVARMLYEAGAGKDFSDLPIPFAVVATDMETGGLTVLDTGPVLPAVEASIALPFIARPVSLGGRLYVDGGVLDTAPVRVARQLGADRIITVCLGYNYSAPGPLRRRPWTRSFFERAGRQRAPVTGRFPDQIRFGCRLYASSYDPPLPAQDADIAIWPDLGSLNPNSIFGARFAFERGLEAARSAVPAIRQMLAQPDAAGADRERA